MYTCGLLAQVREKSMVSRSNNTQVTSRDGLKPFLSGEFDDEFNTELLRANMLLSLRLLGCSVPERGSLRS